MSVRKTAGADGSGRGDPEPRDDESARPGDSPRRDVFLCDLCGAEMVERHCKLLCPACGYQRDCSDP